MPENEKKTTKAQSANESRKWYLVDAENKVLGRLATRVATVLRGKEKPSFVPYRDDGDYVIVVNADKIRITGQKATQKIYYRHTTYPGGLKKRSFEDQMARDSTKVIEHAVKGMIPKNKLGHQLVRKLFVYAGPAHKHQAQKPEALEI